MERYGGSSFNLTSEKWLGVAPKRPATVDFWPGDGTLVVDGVEYGACR